MNSAQNTCEFVLLRHGFTKANAEKRYAGRTDYPLLPEGREQLKHRDYSSFADVQRVFTSPLLRCRQSADIIFPGYAQTVIPALIECDFGDFEDKNHIDMSGNPYYQAWVDSGGTLPFPNGEDVEEFKDRCAFGMKEVIGICLEDKVTKAAVVIHGGVIMGIMTRLCMQKRDNYYEWHPENGCGYVVRSTPEGTLDLLQEITF